MVLTGMAFLLPSIGVPNELMLQDTLKSAVMAFGVLAAALVFFWQQRHRNTALVWHGVLWLPLALVAYALCSMGWSHTYLAGVEAVRWGLLGLLVWLGLNTLTPQNTPAILWGVHAGAAVACVWAALQFWMDVRWFPQSAPPASSFINRNFFAEYLVCTLPISVLLLAKMRSARGLIAMSGSLALNVVALMMTGTRSALIALWVMLPVLCLIWLRYGAFLAWPAWSRNLRVAVALTLFAGVVGLGSVPTGNARILAESGPTSALHRSLLRTASIAAPTEYTEGSFSIRSVMWKATLRMVADNPWTGVGAGAWDVHIPRYQGANNNSEIDFFAHNEWLQLLAEYGVLAGGLFIAFLLAYLLQSAGVTWKLQGAARHEAALRATALTSLLALLIVSNAGFPWHMASTVTLFALCLALLAASDTRLGQGAGVHPGGFSWSRKQSVLASCLLALAIAMAVWGTVQAARAERLFIRAIYAGNALRATALPANGGPDAKVQALQQELSTLVHQGLAISPHYRQLASVSADGLMASGDEAGALRIWEKVVLSRPNIANMWANMALVYLRRGALAQSEAAFLQLQRLQPLAPRTQVIEVFVLARTGRTDRAAALLQAHLADRPLSAEWVEAAYSIGRETRNWPLAVQALELRLAHWPQQQDVHYFRLGQVYVESGPHNEEKALRAFRAGLSTAAPTDTERYRAAVPLALRGQLDETR